MYEEEQLTPEGLVASIAAKKASYKEARKKWEEIWKDQEERWHLITHGKSESWMSDLPTSESNTSVESVLPEIEESLFGGQSGNYFGETKFGTYAPLPVIHELMKLRLDKQIKLRKLFGGNYGLRDLVIKGSMVGMVGWKRQGGSVLKYIQAVDPVTGQPDYTVEEGYKDNVIDRPDVRLLPLESVYIEPVDNFADATKIHVESVPTSEVYKKYSTYAKKLEQFPYPTKEESTKDTRPQQFKDDETEKKKPTRDMVELTHCWGWWSVSQMDSIKKQMENPVEEKSPYDVQPEDQGATTQDRHSSKQQMLADRYNEPKDETPETNTEEVDESKEAFYHIIIGNRAVLLEMDKSPYILQPDPFFVTTYIPISGEHYGLGIPYIIKGAQDRIKDLLDLQLDNIKLRLYSMLKYKPNSTIDKLVLKIKPMGLIPDRSGNDVSFLEVPDATRETLATVNDARAQAREGSGATQLVTGSGDPQNRSATGITISSQQSGKKFRFGVRWIGYNSIVPILDKVYALDRQFTPPKEVGRLLGDQYAQEWMTKTPEEMYPEAEFQFIHSADLVAAEFKVRALNDMNAQYKDRAWWNELAVARESLTTMGIDPISFLIPPEMLAQQQNPQMIPPAGGSQTNSGGNAPAAPAEFTQPHLNGTGA